MAVVLLLLLLLALHSVSSLSIEGILQYPDATPFNETTRVTLNHGEYQTYSRPDGRFVLHNIPPGIHVIDAQSVKIHFSQVKLQVIENAAPKCLEYAYPGATKRPVDCPPVVLTAVAKYDYFEKKRGFSLLGMLKNPMVLMMIFSAGMMFLMPKMMENMDEEEKARMKQQMEMQKDPTKMLSSLWGDLTGSSEPEPKKKK